VKNLLQRIFGGSDPEPVAEPAEENSQLITAPLNEDTLVELAQTAPSKLEPPQLVVGCARSVGMQRDHNEDSLFTLTANIGVDSVTVPFGVYIVADGMGGHQFGEVASEVAIRTMSNHILEKIYLPVFGLVPKTPSESLQEIMSAGVLAANAAVASQAPGGGTTLTAVVVMGSRMTVAHVGDSRAYAVFTDGRMQALTRDHSLVKRLEEMGQITAEEAEVHPQKNVLYRALGQAEIFEPEVSTSPLPVPGYVLICSDGLWGLLSEADMFRLISEAPNPHRACQALVDAANAAGGHDNITAILIRMPE